jgi:hypothetical protein
MMARGMASVTLLLPAKSFSSPSVGRIALGFSVIMYILAAQIMERKLSV